MFFLSCLIVRIHQAWGKSLWKPGIVVPAPLPSLSSMTLLYFSLVPNSTPPNHSSCSQMSWCPAWQGLRGPMSEKHSGLYNNSWQDQAFLGNNGLKIAIHTFEKLSERDQLQEPTDFASVKAALSGGLNPLLQLVRRLDQRTGVRPHSFTPCRCQFKF